MRGVPVGRASIELLVIVVGVLSALAVDRWVAEIDEAELEREYLAALRVEFVANRQTATERARAERQLAELGASLIQVLEGEGETMSPEEVVVATELSGYTVYRTYSRGVWDDLSSTSSTVTIRDPELRIALSEFYHRMSWRDQLEGEFFDYTRSFRYPAREMLDPQLRLAMNAAFAGWEEGFVERTRGGLEGRDLRATASAIRQASELAVPLGDVVMARRVSAQLYEDDVQRIQAILELIDQADDAL